MTPTTLTLTIGTESREVAVRDIWGDGERLDTVERVGAFKKPGANKVWAHGVTFWRQADGTYKAARSTTILNRTGYTLIGFADEINDRAASKHNSSYR